MVNGFSIIFEASLLLLRGRPCLESMIVSSHLLFFRDGETTNKTKCVFERGGIGGREENRPKRCFFFCKRHDNTIMKAQLLLSRNCVVTAQASSFASSCRVDLLKQQKLLQPAPLYFCVINQPKLQVQLQHPSLF